ncbi:MAG: inosine/xanthosine triphosphatase [Candidatus Geothermarchaeales archaeon]
MRRVKAAVGTANPLKVKAVKRGFSAFFEDAEVLGVEVDSGVATHPFAEAVVEGAINRAVRTKRAARCEFGVGLEGGTQEFAGRIFNLGWAAVAGADGVIHVGSTGWWECPPSVYGELVRGRELGDVVDELTGRRDTKRKEGAVGVFTRGILTREDITAHSVVLALIPFLNEELYEKKV